jgi:hypothetical protein
LSFNTNTIIKTYIRHLSIESLQQTALLANGILDENNNTNDTTETTTTTTTTNSSIEEQQTRAKAAADRYNKSILSKNFELSNKENNNNGKKNKKT